MATGSFDGLHGSGENGQWGWFGGSDYKPNQWGYVDYTGYQCKVRGRFTTTAPSTGYKLNTITLTFSVRRNGASNLRGYLYTSQPTTTTAIPSNSIASAATPGAVGATTTTSLTYTWARWSLTFNVASAGITTAQTLYVWLMTNSNISGAYTEIGDGYSGSSRVSVSVTETPIATYSVTYNGNGNTGGTVPGAQTKIYNVGLTLSSNTLTHSATYPNAYKPTFNANGGSVSPTTVQQTYTRTWTHNGWRLNGTSGTLYSKGGTYSTNAAATFYASWSTSDALNNITTPTATRSNSTATRTVTFQAGNGSGTPSKSSVSSTQTTTYTANGWYTATSGGTKRCANGGSYKPTSSETLYQQWGSSTGSWTTAVAATVSKSNSTSNCTITYNANGGSCSKTTDTCSRTTTYTCTGWWTQTSGGTKRCGSGATFTPAATETLYPQFTPSTGVYNSVTLPTATKTGYTFAGWSTSSTATSGTTGTYTPTGDVTLYAIFSQNTFTLTVYKNSNYQGSGTSNETFSLTYNATKNFQDGYRANRGWGGWYWSGSYTWKNFGATTYCATVWSDGQRRTGSWQLFSDIGLHTYNNAGNSTRPVTASYVADSNSGTNYVFQLAFSASSSGSAYGFWGPMLNGSTLQNSRWVHVFRAKIPAEYYLCPTANSMGGATSEIHWLTDNKGTGGYKDYAYERRFGISETPSTSAFPYVSLSTTATGLNVPKVAVTIQVAFSIVYRGAEYAINRTLTMANSNMGILAQAYEPIFWTYQLLNGGSSTLATKTYHNFGTAYTIPAPTRTNYTFTNWTRIYATNIFKETWRYINNTSGNTYNVFKIQLFTYTGTYVKNIVDNSNTSVYGTWTCDVTSGVYWIKYGMNGSTADNMRFERMWLDNGAVYGYYWERVNTTSGQDITINNFIFGRSGSTTTTNYPTTSNYSVYLKANWTANGTIYYNANGGWLNPAGYSSSYSNDTTTPLGRVQGLSHSASSTTSTDLYNYNNPNALNLIRFGYSVPAGQEWRNSAGTLFNQDSNYTYAQWIPTLTTTNPASEELILNWQPNNYILTLQGTGGNATVISTYGTIANLDDDSKPHYTFMGWFKACQNPSDYAQLGRDYMWNDKFAAHLTAYKDDWSTTDNSTRLITCATTGGWSITQNSDDNCVQANVYKNGAWVRAKSNIILQSLSSGFHDFDIVFTGSALQLYIDNTLVASTAVAAPIAYRVTGTTTTQLLIGTGATSVSATNPKGIVTSAQPLGGYIGNVVVAHQNTKIDSTAARTQWNTPVENTTLKSLFRENPYVQIHLNIGNGIVMDSDNHIYHNGDIIKFYYEDDPSEIFTCYPPTAQMITSFTTTTNLTNVVTNIMTTGTPSTTSYTDGELSISYTANGNASNHVDVYLSMTYADLPVLRYQYLLVDNNSNNLIDNNGNNIKVTVKYIPYRHNGSTWQRCEPRGYSNGWKLGG